jgi:putative FmdB family regulatory protein
MPTYEYECTSCGRHIEVFQRFTEDPLTTCEACGGSLRKVFHPAGIVFKGSGFYATDSRKSSGGSGAASDRSDKPETAGKDKKDKKDSNKGDGSKGDGSSSKSGDTSSASGGASTTSSTSTKDPS